MYAVLTFNCRNYENLGLDYKLKMSEILFNKWLTLLKLGLERESAVVLKTIIEANPSPELEALISRATKSLGEGTPCSLVSRPSILHVAAH
jgi:hypothetical protein